MDSCGDLVCDVFGEINIFDVDGNLVFFYVSGCCGFFVFEGFYIEICDCMIVGIMSDSFCVWEGVKLKEELLFWGYYFDGEFWWLVFINLLSEWIFGFSMCDGDIVIVCLVFIKIENNCIESGIFVCSVLSYVLWYLCGNVLC